MGKKISGKLIAIIAAGVGVVAIAAGILIWQFAGKNDTYRSIQIYELSGITTITRDGIGQMEAVENLYLESGDRLVVGEESTARLKLDDDKYILVEENSELVIVAEGNKVDSKTTIHLVKGAITNEIQNKLTDDSFYEVTTPNSVMAVRGTVFRVEVYYDESGEVYAKVSTFEGKVVSSLIHPDGTREEETLLIPDGKEATIHMDLDITEFLTDEPTDIVYEEIPLVVLECLVEIIENGTELQNISLDELQELVEQKIEEREPETEETEPMEETEETEEPETEETEEPDSVTDETNNTGTGTGTDETKNPDTGTGETTPDESAETTPATYKVTFSYNGQVFGQQEVTAGSTVSKPKLNPAESGAWDFDFTQPINQDVTIEWK